MVCRPVERNEYTISAHTVNAYYSRTQHVISEWMWRARERGKYIYRERERERERERKQVDERVWRNVGREKR